MSIVSDYTITAPIHAPLENIHLTEWLFSLRDHEYIACSPGHIAGGFSVTKDNRRMSLNVEQIGGNILVQHYIEQISMKDHCRVQSCSDSFSPIGNSQLLITWEIRVRKLSDIHCEFSNRVIVAFTDEFLALLRKANIVDIEPVRKQMAENAVAHNTEETPLFALDVERKALAGIWL